MALRNKRYILSVQKKINYVYINQEEARYIITDIYRTYEVQGQK